MENFPLKLADSKSVVTKLEEENCENIIEAESQHSDLVIAKYEGKLIFITIFYLTNILIHATIHLLIYYFVLIGGLKVWECTYDLGNYILEEKIPLNNTQVLDLGCGAGIIGLIAFLKGSNVHFQDYVNTIT